MRHRGAPFGAPPPFFQGRNFLATLFGVAFGLAFSGVKQSSDAKGHRDNERTRSQMGTTAKSFQIVGRVEPTGPARSGRPDDRLRETYRVERSAT
jgi:hypothetical protein